MSDRAPKRVLAIDSATSCGFAHDPPEGVRAAIMNRAHLPISGTWKLEGWKPDVVDQSYATLFNNIVQAISANQIDVVVIERPLSVYAHAGFQIDPSRGWKGFKGAGRKDPDLAEALLGFVAVSQCAAARMGCKVYRVAPSTVRAHFCGNGRPADPKAAVMTRCRQLGWSPVDHNAGDALATWDYAKSVLSPGWAWNSTEMGASA